MMEEMARQTVCIGLLTVLFLATLAFCVSEYNRNYDESGWEDWWY